MHTEQWKEVLRSEDLEKGGTVLIKPERVLVVRLDNGSLHAVDNMCPHEGYPLAKGDLKGCVLTCRWHNFRFDVRTGAALLGDEAVRTYPVREANGAIHIDFTPLDPSVLRARHETAFDQAVHDGRLGQAAREAARLVAFGVPGRDLLLRLARLDARHTEYGTSHVLPLITDLAALLPTGDSREDHERTVLLVQHGVDMAFDSFGRRPAREPKTQAAPSVLKALHLAIQAEEVERAEALARHAATTEAPDALFDTLLAACADHFLAFGHGLIYTVKLRELGELGDPDLVGALVYRLANSTREDVLPEWSAWRRWRATLKPSSKSENHVEDDLADQLANATPAQAYVLFDTALALGRRQDLLDALCVVACERVQRFDAAWDADPTVQNGWLDVTHILTFAEAVRTVGIESRHALSLMAQLVRFAAHHRALDQTPNATTGRNIDATTHADPVGTARAVAMGGAYTKAIVVAHIFKTATAVESLSASLPSRYAMIPGQALAHLLNAGVNQGFTRQRVSDACRFVFDGKVPRSRT